MGPGTKQFGRGTKERRCNAVKLNRDARTIPAVVTPDNIRSVQSSLISNSIDNAAFPSFLFYLLDIGAALHSGEKESVKRRDTRVQNFVQCCGQWPSSRPLNSVLTPLCGIRSPFQGSFRIGCLHRNPLSRDHEVTIRKRC